MNISHLISRQISEDSPTRAVVTPQDSITYEKLEKIISSTARYLADNGIQPGDVVAISASDELVVLTAYLSVMRLGASAFAVPAHYPDIQKSEMLASANARHLLIEPSTPGYTDQPCSPILLDRRLVLSLPHQQETYPGEPSPDALALILYGSGSTGKPKLMGFSHRLLDIRAQRIVDTMSISGLDRLASHIHLNFYTCLIRALAIFKAGATFVLLDRGQLTAVDQLRRLDVNVLQSSVQFMEKCLQDVPPDSSHHMGFLRAITIGSSVVPQDLRERMSKLLTPNIFINYGTNECGTISVAYPNELLYPEGNIGSPCKDNLVEIVDNSGKPVPEGNVGKIRVRSPAFIEGYINNPEATSLVFRDGWFYPGDLAKFSPEGQIIYQGRADRMMIMNGINIYPAEIESTMKSHGAVQDAFVFSLKHRIHQDIPVCALSLHPEASASDDELTTYARQRLGARGPKFVVILNEIPRTDQGKVDIAQIHGQVTARLKELIASESSE